MKKFKKKLPCTLNDTDIAILAHTLIGYLQTGESLKLRAKAVAADFKDKVTTQNSLAKEIENQIEARTREQEVECGEIVPPGSGEAITLRLDTGAEVGRRAITDDDKQGSLLTLVEPVDEQQSAEQEDERRILSLFDLAELLRAAGMELGRNLQRLWTLNAEQIAEARKWGMQAKSVGLNQEKPEAPEWLLTLQAESLKDVAAEKELDVRVNTIRAVLVEQSVIVKDEDIRSWSRPEQDEVMAWTDSLLSEAPLPRPEFLTKFVHAEPGNEPWMPPAEGQDAPGTDGVAVISDDAPASGEAVDSASEAESAAGDGPFENLDETPVAETDQTVVASNGHLSREDMATKIQEMGVDVDPGKVAEWSEEEAALAVEWIKSTQESFNANGERKAAPAFFFE